MKKISALHTYLQNLNLFNAEKFSSWVEELKLIVGNEHEYYEPKYGQVLLCVERYTAQFEIDDFPHKELDISTLNGHIAAWLLENEKQYKTLPFEVPINAEVYDDNTALVEFGLEFDEFVIAVPDTENGTITINGKLYSLIHDPA